MNKRLSDFFENKKVLIGMIHLAGKTNEEIVSRALDEINIYDEEGFDGAIVEDYHGNLEDVEYVLKILLGDLFNIKVGVNTLKNPYLAFELANKYKAGFVQFDTIRASAGDENNPKRFNEEKYMSLRKKYPHIFVLGGVRFKYVPPTGKSLEEDIADGMSKCDAIVTTGEGTGIETPIEKLIDFRRIMGDFPLFSGAGVNARNAREQFSVVNGAIMGSYLKGGDTEAPVVREYVRGLVELVRS